MRVFIENEQGSDQKNIFDEKSCTLIRTVRVSATYPFPYGFVLNTTSGDGCNVDCFVITDRKLVSGEIIECEPVALLEQIEDGLVDHKIRAIPLGDQFTGSMSNLRSEIEVFTFKVFAHVPGKKIVIGALKSRQEAETFLKVHEDQETRSAMSSIPKADFPSAD